MKKILLYTDTPQVGGAELQMYLLAKFLDKNAYTPILACSNSPKLDKWCQNFEQEGIKVIRLNVSHKHDPRHYFQLKKILRTEKIDLLHIHVWNPASGRYGFMAAKSTKTPIIVTEHDPFKLSFLKNLFKSSALKSTAKIITVSENNAKILRKIYPKFAKKIEVILNGVDITWWQSQILRFSPEEKNEIRKELFKADEKDFVVATVAELHERKGHRYLIEAAREVLKKFPNLKFVFIGDGPHRKQIEKQIKKSGLEERITLTGKQKYIPKLLKSAEMFVLPSRREAFGLVLVEAMLAELPIVAAKVGGIPEVLGNSGLLVKPENSKELAKTIINLLGNKNKMSSLAKAGKLRAEKIFGASDMAKKYKKAYGAILK